MHSSSIIVYELLNCVLFMYVRARNVCILYSTYMHVCTSNIYSCNEEGMIKICDNGLRSRAATDVLPSLRSRNRYYS